MKKLLIRSFGVALLMITVSAFMPVESQPQPTAAQQTCPAGSYDIGISKDGSPICKLEPTGCPYGDSIPLGPDCDKQKPLEQSTIPVTPVTSTPDYPSGCVGK